MSTKWSCELEAIDRLTGCRGDATFKQDFDYTSVHNASKKAREELFYDIVNDKIDSIEFDKDCNPALLYPTRDTDYKITLGCKHLPTHKRFTWIARYQSGFRRVEFTDINTSL